MIDELEDSPPIEAEVAIAEARLAVRKAGSVVMQDLGSRKAEPTHVVGPPGRSIRRLPTDSGLYLKRVDARTRQP